MLALSRPLTSEGFLEDRRSDSQRKAVVTRARRCQRWLSAARAAYFETVAQRECARAT